MNAFEQKQTPIKFYKVNEPFGYLANFAPYGFELDGKFWPTSEHYYQAHKFTDEKLQERVRLAKTPMEAANIGRDKSLPLREDWETAEGGAGATVKDAVMKKALVAKFTSNPEIRRMLVETYPRELVENTTGDCYWGCGADGTGKNKLGELLMEVRGELLTTVPSCQQPRLTNGKNGG